MFERLRYESRQAEQAFFRTLEPVALAAEFYEPDIAARLLAGGPHLWLARRITGSHHENHDGSGYPDASSHEAIPLEARIVRVVDVCDALRTGRPHKPPMAHHDAVATMLHGDARISPTFCDPQALTTFCDLECNITTLYHDLAGAGEARSPLQALEALES